jgi:putative tricarboxylic transport membrane protein
VVGPGFFPSIIAVLGVGLALVMLIKPAAQNGERPVGFDAVALAPAVLLLVYVLSLEYLGFSLATVVFLVAAFKYLGCPGWVRPVLYSIVATMVLIGLFHYTLGLMLPRGELLRLF